MVGFIKAYLAALFIDGLLVGGCAVAGGVAATSCVQNYEIKVEKRP